MAVLTERTFPMSIVIRMFGLAWALAAMATAGSSGVFGVPDAVPQVAVKPVEIPLETLREGDVPAGLWRVLQGRGPGEALVLLRSVDGRETRPVFLERLSFHAYPSTWVLSFYDPLARRHGTLRWVAAELRSAADVEEFESWLYPMGGAMRGQDVRRPEGGWGYPEGPGTFMLSYFDWPEWEAMRRRFTRVRERSWMGIVFPDQVVAAQVVAMESSREGDSSSDMP